MNIAYFQAISNQRARKKRILVLETLDGLLEDTKDMLNHREGFYKHLFVRKIQEFIWEEGDKVTDSKNELLEAPFTKEEIKNGVFDSYAEEGPALMVFLFFSINLCM